MKNLKLLLTNPCLKQWDDLEPSSLGRYCDNCEKHVVDLSTKSDIELTKFFKKKKDNICGRVLTSQLNRDLKLPVEKPNWMWLVQVAMGAMFVTPAKASFNSTAIMQNTQQFFFPTLPQELNEDISPILVNINGTVVNDEDGKPLMGVKIKLKDFENVLAITDSLGQFKLVINKESINSTFVFEFSGFLRTELKLSDQILVRMAKEKLVMLGGISIVSNKKEPLYIIFSGKKNCTINPDKLSEISPEWIENISVLKDTSATAIYGSKAANGVVIVEIKKDYARKIKFSDGNKFNDLPKLKE